MRFSLIVLTALIAGCFSPTMTATTHSVRSIMEEEYAVPRLSESTYKITGILGGGTGWALEGHVLVTAKHVIEGQETAPLTVTDVHGKAIGISGFYMDPAYDIAFITTIDEMVPLPVRTGKVTLGESIVALGFPNISNPAVSHGSIFSWEWNHMQLDCTVIPGMSGGPVLAGDKVIGMIVAVTLPQVGRPVGIATPIDTVLRRRSLALGHTQPEAARLPSRRGDTARTVIPRRWDNPLP